MADLTEHEAHAHQLAPVYDPTLFQGTAEYYSQFRPKYPPVLVDAIVHRLDLRPEDRLLDLACGTGEVSFALHDAVSETWAIDLEPDMIAEGHRKAAELGLGSMQWILGRAEDVLCPEGYFGVVATGRAFHRLNRPLTAGKALKWLRPQGYFLDMGSDTSGLSHPTEPWLALASEVYERWVSSAYRPRQVTRSKAEPDQPKATTESVLSDVGFRNVAKYEFDVPYVWSLDEFVGYLYSTSYSSKGFWGDTHEDFERDLRAALLDFDPAGQYKEMISAYFVVGQAP